MIDERIRICSTCNKRVADEGEAPHILVCCDPVTCRSFANFERKSKGFGELTGPITWFHAPTHVGSDPEGARNALYQQQKFNDRYTALENIFARMKTELWILRGILLLLLLSAMLITLSYRSGQ